MNEAMLPSLLRTRRMSFSYAGQRLFENFDLDVSPGVALVLVGDNGSGKTTLLRLLAGLLSPDDGEIACASEDGGESVTLAWLGHALGLKSVLTVAENLVFSIGLNGHDKRLTPAQALASVGLDGFEQVPVRELSAGQCKRVALARLLLSPAAVWLLDEPYANLDADGCRLVDRLIDRHLRSGGAAALSVHRIEHATFDGQRRVVSLTEAA